ncbi:MAG: TetR family transcriptional regulator [Capsulimonas sp.]|jgi:AcrR family transcriptional regulator|nr:TetR family transcriptional regulator [Capsulimonas sp.]
MSSEKEERILKAARDVFARYGYVRTTMADVAKAAGISRPALYLVFAKKEELFGAVIHRMNDDIFERIHSQLDTHKTLEQKLTLGFELWVGQSFDLAYASPDARDLFEYENPAMQEVAAEFQAFLADLLREAVRVSTLKVTPEELAQALLFAVHGFKTVAKDGADLRRMIAIQISLTIAALPSA